MCKFLHSIIIVRLAESYGHRGLKFGSVGRLRSQYYYIPSRIAS